MLAPYSCIGELKLPAPSTWSPYWGKSCTGHLRSAALRHLDRESLLTRVAELQGRICAAVSIVCFIIASETEHAKFCVIAARQSWSSPIRSRR
jgi:hypothetical protein